MQLKKKKYSLIFSTQKCFTLWMFGCQFPFKLKRDLNTYIGRHNSLKHNSYYIEKKLKDKIKIRLYKDITHFQFKILKYWFYKSFFICYSTFLFLFNVELDSHLIT